MRISTISDYTDLISGYYVEAPLLSLVAINDFSLWFFVWDDRHDRDISHRRQDAWSRLRDTLHDALDAPSRHLQDPDPLISSFCDCVTRLLEPFSDHWNARFTAHFHATIDAYDREYRNRTTGSIPTVDDYLRLRRHTFGMWVWIDCLELAADYELPPEICYSPVYRNAGLASQEFSAWYNDPHSMPKELAAGDFHNLGHRPGPSQRVACGGHRRGAGPQGAEPHHRLPGARDRSPGTPGHDEGKRRATRRHRAVPVQHAQISSVYWFHKESGRYKTHSWGHPAKPPYIRDPDD